MDRVVEELTYHTVTPTLNSTYFLIPFFQHIFFTRIKKLGINCLAQLLSNIYIRYLFNKFLFNISFSLLSLYSSVPQIERVFPGENLRSKTSAPFEGASGVNHFRPHHPSYSTKRALSLRNCLPFTLVLLLLLLLLIGVKSAFGIQSKYTCAEGATIHRL